jgi:hypothetical protein
MSKKALAGPKYVINVRFNQPGYKAYTDGNAHPNAELFHVKPHEVLVRAKKPHRSNRERMTGVQSWCPSEDGAFDTEYTFAGVAETGQDASHRHSMQQGLAMCVSGIVKAFNESGGMVAVGDYLTYGPNNRRTCQDGVPKNKLRATFIKYDSNKPAHVARGIVARAETAARNLESFDAHVFANGQFNVGMKPSLAHLLILSEPATVLGAGFGLANPLIAVRNAVIGCANPATAAAARQLLGAPGGAPALFPVIFGAAAAAAAAGGPVAVAVAAAAARDAARDAYLKRVKAVHGTDGVERAKRLFAW